MKIRIEEDEYKYLENWATREFLSVTQLAKVIVKRANAENKKSQQVKSS